MLCWIFGFLYLLRPNFHLKKLIREQIYLYTAPGAFKMGGQSAHPTHLSQDKKMILHMLRQMWLNGDSTLRRIYSSWEEFERNLEITTEAANLGKQHTRTCPKCGAKQKITLPFAGIFPLQTCKSCQNPFYINKNLTVRKLSEEEKRELPGAWFQIIEDMNKHKIAVVFRLE